MNIQEKTRGLVEASMTVAITSMFAIIGAYIPILTFVLFFIPVPFIILGKRHGLQFQILSIIASAIIIGVLVEPLSSIMIMIYFGIMSAVMGYMMKKDYSPGKVWAGGTVASLIASIIMINLISLITGMDVIEGMLKAFEESMDITISLYQGMGIEQSKLDQMKTFGDEMVRMMGMIIPAGVIFSAAFFAYMNYLITVFVLNRIGQKAEAFPPFRVFRLPKSAVMGTLIIVLLTIAMQYFKMVHYETLVLNVYYIFSTVFMIQGLAVISYWMSTFQMKRPVRILIYILALFNPILVQVVTTLGFVDTFANFRKLNK